MSYRPLPPDARPAISKVPYLPGLDGMRALAVVAVMLYHTNNGWVPGGFIGVEVFFVISGYLITLLLIGEHERSGGVNLADFWLRRARRLLPALYLMLTLLIVYCAIFVRDQLGNIRGDVIAGLLYVSNWFQIWTGQGYTALLDFAPLRHLWSLAVEEQFYLVWPLIMIALLRGGRHRLPNISRWLVLAAVVVTVVVAVLFYSGPVSSICADTPDAYWQIGSRCIAKNDALYLSTISRSAGLLLGGAFAMLWRPAAVMRSPLRHRGRELDLIALVGFAGLALMAWKLHVAYPDGRGDPWLFRGGFFAVSVCTLMMVAAVTHRAAASGTVLGTPVLAWIGMRSYGLYLYHWPIYQIIRKQSGAGLSFGEFVLAMVITVAITEASYRFVETPIRKKQLHVWWQRLRYGTRDRRQRQIVGFATAGVVALVGFATVSLAVAEPKRNDIEQMIADNQDAISSIDDIIAGASSTTVVVDPNATTVALDPNATTTVAPVDAATTTVAAGPVTPSGPPIAFGDSVMVGAAKELQELGYEVIAQEGRQFAAEVGVAQQLAASGVVPPVVVVHLGTNGSMAESDVDAFFGALSNVPLVVVLNLWGPDEPWIAPNNEVIASLPSRFPNVVVGDWAAVAPTCEDWRIAQGYQNPCYAASDGYHLGGNGAEFYANQIAGWVAAAKAARGLA